MILSAVCIWQRQLQVILSFLGESKAFRFKTQFFNGMKLFCLKLKDGGGVCVENPSLLRHKICLTGRLADGLTCQITTDPVYYVTLQKIADEFHYNLE